MGDLKCVYKGCQNNVDGNCKFNFPSECELIAIKCNDNEEEED